MNDSRSTAVTKVGVTKTAVFLACLYAAEPAEGQVGASTLREWGREVVAEIDRTLRVSGTSVYAETGSLSGSQSGGINNRAFVWPASTMFRALNSMVEIDPVASSPALRQFSDQLHAAYWNNGYRSGAGGGARFYDDNAHMVVALAEAYYLTNDPVYLARAQSTFAFVLQGEDSAAGGGIYFQQFNNTSKDAVSTLQGARGAALLYRATGQSSYLSDANRLLTWANSHIQKPNGLYYQGFVIANNAPGGVDIVNSAGDAISANVELFAATNNAAYLSEAQRIASASLTRFFDAATGRINDEGYWAFELIDALHNLHRHDGNVWWLDRARNALTWLHNNKRDPNGHYGLFWGRNGPETQTLADWNLNEQASVARAYLYTASAIAGGPSSMRPGDVNQDGELTEDDVTAFVAGWRSDTSHLLFAREKLQRGDLNLDGVTNLTDFSLLRGAMYESGLALSAATIRALQSTVPEPSSAAVAALAVAATANRARRQIGRP